MSDPSRISQGPQMPSDAPNEKHPSGEDLVEAIARRVVELLREPVGVPSAPAPSGRVLTAREVAERLGRPVGWVRDHRDQLGLVPVVGERPRLLFDALAVEAWATARGEVVDSQPAQPAPSLVSRSRRPRPSGSGVDLLPVHRPIVERRAA